MEGCVMKGATCMLKEVKCLKCNQLVVQTLLMVINCDIFYRFLGINLVKIENNRQYLSVRGDHLLENEKECKEPEEKQIFMLCLLLILCGVMSEGIRIHLDFNVCCIIQMFSDWGSLTVLILPSLQVSIVSFKVIHLGVYVLGSPHLLQLGGLYTGHCTSPTAGSIFETPSL
jgi:hypothetical protein